MMVKKRWTYISAKLGAFKLRIKAKNGVLQLNVVDRPLKNWMIEEE